MEGFEVSVEDFTNGIREFISRGETGTIQLEKRKPSPPNSGGPGMGAITPLGGLSFLAGWLLLAIAAFKYL